jgi:hypothetical protein
MLTAALNATAVAAGDAAGLLQAFEEGSLGVSFGIAGVLLTPMYTAAPTSGRQV